MSSNCGGCAPRPIIITGDGAAPSSFVGPVDNGDGTVTFTHDDGAGNTVDLTFCPDCSTAVSNGDGTATFSQSDGTVITVCEVCPTVVDNGDGTFLSLIHI